MIWTRNNGVSTAKVGQSRLEVMPRLTKTGKQKKGAGYDVYHRNQTRRVWIGHALTADSAREVAAKKLV